MFKDTFSSGRRTKVDHIHEMEYEIKQKMMGFIRKEVTQKKTDLYNRLANERDAIQREMKTCLVREESNLLYSTNGEPNTDTTTWSIPLLCFVISSILKTPSMEYVDHTFRTYVYQLQRLGKRFSLQPEFDGSLQCLIAYLENVRHCHGTSAELYKSVLRKADDVINEMLEPHPIVDKLRKEGHLPLYRICEFEGSPMTTRINQNIIRLVEAKGTIGYRLFKDCLTETNQTRLRHYLEAIERDQYTAKALYDLRKETAARKMKKTHIRAVLRETLPVIREHLDIEAIIDAFKKDEFIHHATIVDIENLPSNGSKFEHIFDVVKTKGIYGYEKFKAYLVQTGQSLLNQYMEKMENGEDVKPDDQLIEDLKAYTSSREKTGNSVEVVDTNNVPEKMSPRLEVSEENDGDECTDMELHKRVLDRSLSTIQECLIPEPVLDEFTEQEFLPFQLIRDIRESQTTTKTNQSIVQNVRAKGERGYEVFKKSLQKSNQILLHTYLEKVEKGADTDKVRIELKKESEEREKSNRKKKRKEELKEESTVNAIEENLINAIKKGFDFEGQQDIEEKVNVQGSTKLNTRNCCYTIKCIFEQETADIYSEQIVVAVQDIASMINVELRKTSIDKDSCVVITMACSSCKEMRELLKTLRGQEFQTGINRLQDACAAEYEDTFVVEAKLSPEKIVEVHDHLRDQGIIEKREANSFCDQHVEKPQLNEFVCPEHDVFCCEECAKTTHRICPGLRQITTDPILEADKHGENEHISLKRRKEYRIRIDEPELCTTKELCVLSNSEIILIDNVNNRLKKLNMLYKADGHCNLPKAPLDICVVDDITVLVSFGDTVSFVDVKGTPTLGEELMLKKPCYCLTWHDNAIYYTDKLSLFKCNRNGQSHEEYHGFGKEGIKCNQIAIRNDGMKIYIAADAKGLITVDTRQKKQSVISHELKMCTDICVVTNKCLLVCDYRSHAVYQVDLEGETILKTVVDRSTGVHLPRSIDFDETDSTLVVGRLGRDFISVFEIEIGM